MKRFNSSTFHFPSKVETRPSVLVGHLVLAETAQAIDIVHVFHGVLEVAVLQTLVRSEVRDNDGTLLVHVGLDLLVILDDGDLGDGLLSQIEQNVAIHHAPTSVSLHAQLSTIYFIVAILEKVKRRIVTDSVDLRNRTIPGKIDLHMNATHTKRTLAKFTLKASSSAARTNFLNWYSKAFERASHYISPHALKLYRRVEEQEQIAREKDVREHSFNEAVLHVNSEKEARNKYELKNKKDLKELDSSFNKAAKALDEELRIFKESQDAVAAERNQEFVAQKQQLNEQQKAELAGKGVDTNLLEQYRRALENLKALLMRIDEERSIVIRYRDTEQNLFAKEPEIKKAIKTIEQRLAMIRQRYEDRQTRIGKKCKEMEERRKKVRGELTHRREGLTLYHQMVENEHLVPDAFLSDDKMKKTELDCQQLLSQLRGTVNQKRESIDKLKSIVVSFNRNFKPQNAFHFNTMPVTDNDYLEIAADLQDFMDNNKIEEFRRRTSEHYKDILGRISAEIGSLMKRRSDVDGVIQDINRDFIEKNFAGVIKSIELRADESSDKLMKLLISIHDYAIENAFSIGELNLFSNNNRDEVNRKVVDYLKSLSHQLQNEPNRPTVSLGDAFRLQFRVKENDNDTGWVERINNVGSDGTDILVKAMVNIMLINVFKKKAAKKSGDFIVHCMMDEIGRLHPNNIKGILQFANSRNIYLINSSPTSYNPYDYRYTYLLSKHGVRTRVEKLLKRIN